MFLRVCKCVCVILYECVCVCVYGFINVSIYACKYFMFISVGISMCSCVYV